MDSVTPGTNPVIFSRSNLATFSTSLFIQACGAFTGILTARLLGPVARGQLATIILWPTVLSILGLMGSNWVLAREVAIDPKRESDWATAGLAVGLTNALLYLAIGFFLLPWLLPSERRFLLPVARLCLLLVPLDIFNQVLLSVEHGRMRWRRYNVFRASFFLFYLILVFLIAATRKVQVRNFVFAFLLSHLLTLVLRLWIRRKSLAGGHLHMGRCRRLVRAGVPYFGATASNLLALQLDTILVVSILSTSAAGIYAVAGTFASGQASLGEALGITSFAEVSNETNFGSRERMITETFRQSALFSSGVGLLLACLIPFLVQPLFGAEFSSARWPAVVLAISASVTTSTNILNQGLRGAGRPHAGLVSQVLAIGVMAGAALFYLRRFGIMGIAWAVFLSACVQMVILILAAANWMRISPLRFWPFGARNVKWFWQQVAALCLRYSRFPA